MVVGICVNRLIASGVDFIACIAEIMEMLIFRKWRAKPQGFW